MSTFKPSVLDSEPNPFGTGIRPDSPSKRSRRSRGGGRRGRGVASSFDAALRKAKTDDSLVTFTLAADYEGEESFPATIVDVDRYWIAVRKIAHSDTVIWINKAAILVVTING